MSLLDSINRDGRAMGLLIFYQYYPKLPYFN